MADWTQDPTNPDLVMSPDGRIVPRDTLGPMDRVVAAPTAAPAPAAPAVGAPPAPAVPGAPAPPLNAASVLGKLDAVTAPLNQRSAQLPIAQTTTTTQSAIPQSVLDPIKQRGTERAAAQADAVTQRGENAAQRGEQQAMASSTAAYGGFQQAEADRLQAAQRAEIARQNQLAIAAQKDESIDPDRFVRSMSTGQSIGTVILAALNGAFRGMSGQGGEGVVDILNRRIDQDIAAQKEQIQSGRIRRGNLISYFQQQGMSEDAAERSAKAMSWAQLEKLTAAEIARLGAGGARDEAKVLAETIKAQREQANDELQLTLGTPRSTTSVVRQAPAPTGAGSDGFAKMLAARKAYEDSGATPEQLAVFDKANGLGAMAPAGESVRQQKTREDKEGLARADKVLTEGEGKAEAAFDTLRQYGEAVGLKRDTKTGKYEEGGIGNMLVAPGLRETVPGLLGAGKPIEAAREAALDALARLQTGAAISKEEEIRYTKMLGDDSATRAQIATTLNAIEQLVQSRRKQTRVTGSDAESAGFRRVTP